MPGFSKVQQILIKQYYTFYINILRFLKKSEKSGNKGIQPFLNRHNIFHHSLSLQPTLTSPKYMPISE